MSQPVIKVRGLGKQYRIGGVKKPYRTLRESLTDTALAPFRRLARSGYNGTESANGDTSFWALKDVNFDVHPGEVVGIIGRNGAGKSTLLKVLSRITDPTEGTIEIEGRVGSLLEVGTGFHPELTGRENIYLNGAILGMTRAEVSKKFDEIVAFAETEKFLDTPVKFYSSGMYTRLAFSVAAHLEPDILIVDEVLAVGDAEFQKKCLGKMKDVAAGGRTVLFVTHNMTALISLCTRAVVLRQGEVFRDGGVAQGIAAYMNSFRSFGEVDLTANLDRSGLGQVKFSSIRFEDSTGEICNSGISGEPISVAMSYADSAGEELRNVRASVLVTDQLGQTLFLCSTELTAPDIIDCAPRGRLVCTLPRLPLSGGTYVVSVYLETGGETQDYIMNAATLSVEDGDFFGSGKLYPPGGQGKGVLVDHWWSATRAESTPFQLQERRQMPIKQDVI